MQAPSFIRIEKSLDEAMYFRSSPSYIDGALNFEGVHLLPNNINPYIQRTYLTDGIELEEYQVIIKDLCGNELYTLSPDEFQVHTNFQDDNGTPQIDWKLVNVDFDAGYQLIYLEITQLPLGDIFYTSPFLLTNEEAEYTSRWDYANEIENETVFSTGLRIWFKEYGASEELTSYTPVATGTPLSFTKIAEFEYWQTSLIQLDLFRLITRMRQCKFVYCDYVRTMPYEAIEIPQRAGGENFGETVLSLVRYEDDTYDPLYIQPVPPEPEPPTYGIVLTSVNAPDGNSVTYTFTWFGFEPTVFTLEYSLDQINWSAADFATGSPATAVILNAGNQNYYYRVRYYVLDVTSNVLQLPLPTLVFENIKSFDPFYQSGNRYEAYWTANGFTPNRSISVEVSTDGVTWSSALTTGIGVMNPFVFITPSSAVEFIYFRLYYIPLGIRSNILQYQL